MRRMSAANDETRASEVERLLRLRGLVEPVDPARDARAWSACDLASAAEGAFHESLDPWTMSDEERVRYRERLGESYEEPGLEADLHVTRFLWLTHRRARVGTIALPATGIGRIEMPIWSLYVHPSARRMGIGARVLSAAYEAALASRFGGIQLETHWVWQRAVRFYLARRMWVVGWKHAIAFAWRPSLPRYEIVEDRDELALSVDGKEAWRGARRGDRLVLTSGDAVRDPAVRVYGHATMALALAVRGWPLVRSESAWARRLSSTDLGEVEGLAHKIRAFEANAQANGWEVRTPAIPGMPRDRLAD